MLLQPFVPVTVTRYPLVSVALMLDVVCPVDHRYCIPVVLVNVIEDPAHACVCVLEIMGLIFVILVTDIIADVALQPILSDTDIE